MVECTRSRNLKRADTSPETRLEARSRGSADVTETTRKPAEALRFPTC